MQSKWRGLNWRPPDLKVSNWPPLPIAAIYLSRAEWPADPNLMSIIISHYALIQLSLSRKGSWIEFTHYFKTPHLASFRGLYFFSLISSTIGHYLDTTLPPPTYPILLERYYYHGSLLKYQQLKMIRPAKNLKDGYVTEPKGRGFESRCQQGFFNAKTSLNTSRFVYVSFTSFSFVWDI